MNLSGEILDKIAERIADGVWVVADRAVRYYHEDLSWTLDGAKLIPPTVKQLLGCLYYTGVEKGRAEIRQKFRDLLEIEEP